MEEGIQRLLQGNLVGNIRGIPSPVPPPDLEHGSDSESFKCSFYCSFEGSFKCPVNESYKGCRFWFVGSLGFQVLYRKGHTPETFGSCAIRVQ